MKESAYPGYLTKLEKSQRNKQKINHNRLLCIQLLLCKKIWLMYIDKCREKPFSEAISIDSTQSYSLNKEKNIRSGRDLWMSLHLQHLSITDIMPDENCCINIFRVHVSSFSLFCFISMLLLYIAPSMSVYALFSLFSL